MTYGINTNAVSRAFLFYGDSEFRQIGFFATAVKGKQKCGPRFK